MAGCTIGELAENFGLVTVVSSPKSISKKISVIEVDRPGLELAGFYEYHQKTRLVLIGKKELAFISHMQSFSAYQAILQICAPETPGIVICHGLPCPEEIKRAAEKKDCAVFQTLEDTSTFEADVLNFLSEKLAPKTSIHANLMEIFGCGTLMIGDSGIGKSEVSLDLLKRGHVLVSDDKVEILNVRNKLEGSSPAITFGMMEVRGIGIIDVSRMFGINAVKRKSQITYCVDMRLFNPKEVVDRLGSTSKTIEYLGVKVPYVKLPVSSGRSMAELVEIAITNFKLKDSGFDSAREFERRMDIEREKARIALEAKNKI